MSAHTLQPSPQQHTPTRATPTGHRSPSAGKRVERVGVQVLLWLYAAVAVGPLLLVLVDSLRSTGDILAKPLAWPQDPVVENYLVAWRDAEFSSYLVNSLVVTTGSVVLCCAVSTLVAYVLARWQFWGKAVLGAFFLSGLMLPFHLAAVPIYYLLESINLVDTRLGLILVYAATGIPLAVFVLSSFFRQLPVEMEEAARLDGAGELRLLVLVVLPLVKPALATVAAITYVLHWNDFFFPLVLLRSEEKFTVTVGLTSFFGQYTTDIGPLFAGLVVAVLPLLILFAVATKQIVSGLTLGATK